MPPEQPTQLVREWLTTDLHGLNTLTICQRQGLGVSQIAARLRATVNDLVEEAVLPADLNVAQVNWTGLAEDTPRLIVAAVRHFGF